MATRPLLLTAFLSLMLLSGMLRAEEEPIQKFGHGLTKPDAEQDAFMQARELVIARLKQRRPDLKWTPTTEYLREHGMIINVLDESNYQSDNLGPLHRVTVRVEVSESNMRKMLKQDSLFRRHILAAKLLAAFVALLAVLAAYIRLEDFTRGYYSGPIGAALGTCIVAIGVGLWWVW